MIVCGHDVTEMVVWALKTDGLPYLRSWVLMWSVVHVAGRGRRKSSAASVVTCFAPRCRERTRGELSLALLFWTLLTLWMCEQVRQLSADFSSDSHVLILVMCIHLHNAIQKDFGGGLTICFHFGWLRFQYQWAYFLGNFNYVLEWFLKTLFLFSWTNVCIYVEQFTFFCCSWV